MRNKNSRQEESTRGCISKSVAVCGCVCQRKQKALFYSWFKSTKLNFLKWKYFNIKPNFQVLVQSNSCKLFTCSATWYLKLQWILLRFYLMDQCKVVCIKWYKFPPKCSTLKKKAKPVFAFSPIYLVSPK